jgi:hypothetical protein
MVAVPTNAMQKIDKQSATVMAANLQALGYSKSSSTSSSGVLFSAACGTGSSVVLWLPMGAIFVSRAFSPRTEGVGGGMVLSSNSFVSPIDWLTLWVAVFSESTMLRGRRLSLWFASLMARLNICMKAKKLVDSVGKRRAEARERGMIKSYNNRDEG